MTYKDFEIIDFHTHPFITPNQNICSNKEYCNMSVEGTKKLFDKLGVSTICGSVLDTKSEFPNAWAKLKACNDTAIELKAIYGDFYVPGFHIHPDYVEESLAEMERMDKLGIKLIGELCPYLSDWNDYSCEGFSVLLDEAERRDMIVSFHSMGEDEMDAMVKAHPGVKFVAAHPGEYRALVRHLNRAKFSENYYLDISGYGIFRHGMLRHAIDELGVDKLLFGSDYSTCNPAMYIGGVLLDDLITDEEKEKIFSLNAKKLLNLK